MQLPTTYPAHTYAFWGSAILPGSPTATSPVTQGVGFLIDVNGVLSAATYATGTLHTIAVLNAITDGAVHRYQAYIRGDQIYWSIDGLTAANIQTGALGPDNNNLKVAMLAGVDATGSTGHMILTSAAAFIGDTTRAGVRISPSAAQQFGIFSVVSASAENNHVLKAAPGNLYGIYATNLTTTAGFLVLLNSPTSPGDGAITPLECVPLPASGNASISYDPGPPAIFSTGITAVVTSATTCFTKTTGTITAYLKGSVQ